MGPDGAQLLGVRKKHVLRGTRFSLPKPKVTESLAIIDGWDGWVSYVAWARLRRQQLCALT